MGQCMLTLFCDSAVKHTSTMISPSADHLMVWNTSWKPLERCEQELHDNENVTGFRRDQPMVYDQQYMHMLAGGGR